MSDADGLILGHVLDGNGGSVGVGWSEATSWTPDAGVLWLHLDRTSQGVAKWLEEESGVEPLVAEALLADETRPRAAAIGHGLLVILRGVNLNPGADPEDMVSVRMWVEEGRVISMQARTVMAVGDLSEQLVAGRGPRDSADLLARLAAGLEDRITPVVIDLDEQTDGLEESLLAGENREIRHELHEVRRTAIALRRYLAPQREALNRLVSEERSWLDRRFKLHVREIADRLIRIVEDLDEIRERAAIVQDELLNRMSEQMNRNMYLLSVVAAVMLPLGFVTGLLGINVGGIPGTDSPFGFAVVCAVLAVVALVEIALVRKLHWI